MQVSIYSLKQTLFEGEAQEINCRTQSGEITILDHHRPLVSLLAVGAVKIVDGQKKEHYFNVSGGFLEVQTGNKARLIVEE